MAVVLIEGFDHGTSDQIYSRKGWSGPFINAAAGRFGGLMVRHQGGANYKALPAATTSAVAGCALYTYFLNATDTFLALRVSTTVIAGVKILQSGPNTYWTIVNNAQTVLATGTLHPAVSQWYYVELGLVVSATVGTVELRINGATTAECSASGLNTGTTGVDNIYLNGSNAGLYFDDVYVVDRTTGSSPTNTFLGDVRIETLFPSGNGTNTAWTGTSTDWDDTTTQDDDSTYVSSSTPGAKETSALGDLAVTSGTVFAVQTNLTARKDDAGTRTIAPVLRIGSTDYDGTTTPALNTSYLTYSQLYDRLDPAGAGWTIATVNAMEAGVKEVA